MKGFLSTVMLLPHKPLLRQCSSLPTAQVSRWKHPDADAVPHATPVNLLGPRGVVPVMVGGRGPSEEGALTLPHPHPALSTHQEDSKGHQEMVPRDWIGG